jgi:DNA repair protein RecO (recombination protein O)
MHYIEEIDILHVTENSFDKINRNFIAYFIAEIFSKVLQDNEQNYDLFDYLWILSIKLFNSEKINPNFAILFLLDLSKFLGFYPSLENLEQSFFAIKNSYTAIKRKKNEEDYFNQKSNFLKEIIRGKKVIMPQKIRSEILKDFLKYYKLNYYNLDNVTSHLIIEELR